MEASGKSHHENFDGYHALFRLRFALKSLFTPMGMFHRRNARFRCRLSETGVSAPSPAAAPTSKAACNAYTEADFLRDVYMSAERYHTLKRLFSTKKNVI